MNLVDAGIAAGAGALSVTSPCCLPLLPGYLGYLTGVSPDQGVVRRRRVVTAAALFVLGFTATPADDARIRMLEHELRELRGDAQANPEPKGSARQR